MNLVVKENTTLYQNGYEAAQRELAKGKMVLAWDDDFKGRIVVRGGEHDLLLVSFSMSKHKLASENCQARCFVLTCSSGLKVQLTLRIDELDFGKCVEMFLERSLGM